MDLATFRASYPTFADAGKYTDPQVQMYLTVADLFVNADRWGAATDFGKGLFVEHFLALDALSAAGAAGGVAGVPGTAIGVLSGGTVDKVSYTKSMQSVLDPKAGHWNMTTYGLQFWKFMQMAGAGPLQVGQGAGDLSLSLYNGAWPGPLYGLW